MRESDTVVDSLDDLEPDFSSVADRESVNVSDRDGDIVSLTVPDSSSDQLALASGVSDFDSVALSVCVGESLCDFEEDFSSVCDRVPKVKEREVVAVADSESVDEFLLRVRV